MPFFSRILTIVGRFNLDIFPVIMLASTSSISWRTHILYRWRALLLAGMAGFLCFFSVNALAAPPFPVLNRLDNESFEQQYKSASGYFSRLEKESLERKDREKWLSGVKNFRKIYLAQKKDILGPPSLYMMAKMNRRMYDHFKIPLDLDNAIDYFNMVATLYPGHSLADDALFGAAEGLIVGKEKEQQAAALYHKIVEVYPKSDHYEKALARIQEQEKQRVAPTIVVPEAQPASTNLANIAAVKYWASTDYTRIVIQASSPIHFTSGLLQKDGDQPRRLYIDLAQSAILPKFSIPVPLKDGLLKQIRSGQLNNDTVRVVLDVAALTEYKVFSLSDPFRVIVDIHGRMPPSRAELTPKNTPGAPQQLLGPSPKKSSPRVLDYLEKPIISLEDQKKRSPKIDSPRKTLSHGKISLAQQLGLGVRKIVIDPGHGGKDPGAMAFNLKEKDIVLKISKKIAKILKSTYRYEVALTRTKDLYIPLEERIALANTQNSDLFISIHINAHPDKTIGGIETYFLNLATNADAMRVAAMENSTSTHNISELQDILTNLMKNSKIDESSRLAQFVQTNLVSAVTQKYKPRDLGVKQAPFYVLIGAEMPAILAEISFITNPQEAKLLQDEQYLNKVAEQIAAGIAAYVDHHHTAAVRF